MQATPLPNRVNLLEKDALPESQDPRQSRRFNTLRQWNDEEVARETRRLTLVVHREGFLDKRLVALRGVRQRRRGNSAAVTEAMVMTPRIDEQTVVAGTLPFPSGGTTGRSYGLTEPTRRLKCLSHSSETTGGAERFFGERVAGRPHHGSSDGHGSAVA